MNILLEHSVDLIRSRKCIVRLGKRRLERAHQTKLQHNKIIKRMSDRIKVQ